MRVISGGDKRSDGATSGHALPPARHTPSNLRVTFAPLLHHEPADELATSTALPPPTALWPAHAHELQRVIDDTWNSAHRAHKGCGKAEWESAQTKLWAHYADSFTGDGQDPFAADPAGQFSIRLEEPAGQFSMRLEEPVEEVNTGDAGVGTTGVSGEQAEAAVDDGEGDALAAANARQPQQHSTPVKTLNTRSPYVSPYAAAGGTSPAPRPSSPPPALPLLFQQQQEQQQERRPAPPPPLQHQENGSGYAELIPDPHIEEPQATACVVCWENQPVVAFVPCGHVCVCELCFVQHTTDRKNMANRKNCFICRAEVTGHLRVFLP